MTYEGNSLLRAAKSGGAAVIGIGISNIPLIKFLLKHEIKVVARDKKDWEKLPDTARSLADCGVHFNCGDGYLEDLVEAVIFRSPGVQPWLPQIKAAVARGSRLTSEMELFFALTPAKLIAVTGSDGKTTTTTLIYNMLSHEYSQHERSRVYVGGNIGTPLLPLVNEMTPDDFAVIELSSFQLQTMTASPQTAVITNLSPNHLDWHTRLDQYLDAKYNIFLHKGCERVVLNFGCPLTAPLITSSPVSVTAFSSGEKPKLCKKTKSIVFEREGIIYYADKKGELPLLPLSEIKIPGRHNAENYMAAIAAVYQWVSGETIRHIAKTFSGVEHRIEYVRTLSGVRYYNSSIDSTPSRTVAALRTLGDNLVVICGGRDKKLSFAPLAKALCAHARAVLLTGEAAGQIKEALLSCVDYCEGYPVIVQDNSFDGAVKAAREIARPGETVLLSPACTSFDAFANFEERGNRFKSIVNSFE